MANAISVSVLKYGNEEFGTTLAAAQTMLLNSEHIIYGTNKETKMDVTLTGGVGASNTFTFSGQTGLTAGEYVRVGNVGDAVGTFDVLSADLIAGTIFKVKDINGGDNPTMSMDESGTTATTQNSESGLALEAYIVQGKILYADPAMGGRPVEIITVEPCVNMTNDRGMSSKSAQLIVTEVNKKNGVAFDATTISENNLLLNFDRMMLGYEGDLSTTSAVTDDWVIWYDTSNTNNCGLDAPYVDILEIETDITAEENNFVNHIGGLGGPENFLSLTVNGNTVTFPDATASGFVRLSGVDTYIKLKCTGKAGFDTLVIDDSLSNVVASTDSTNITE